MRILKQISYRAAYLLVIAALLYSLPWLAARFGEIAAAVIIPALEKSFDNLGK